MHSDVVGMEIRAGILKHGCVLGIGGLVLAMLLKLNTFHLSCVIPTYATFLFYYAKPHNEPKTGKD